MSDIHSEFNACMFKADCMKTHEDVNRFKERITQLEADKSNAEYCFRELKKINEQLETELAEAKLSDKDKENLEVGRQILRAARALPDYFDIKVHVENGFAGVTLIDTEGKIRDFDFDENLSSAISEAIDAAIKEQGK